MRSLLIVARADAAAFASEADAVLADAATLPSPPQGPSLYLSVRPLAEPGALDDVRAAARLRAEGVALMRAEGAADVQRLGAWLAVEEARQGLPDGTLRILAFATQTPQAVLALPSYRGASRRLAGLIATDAPTLRGGPLRLARELAVIAARAAGVPVVDAQGAFRHGEERSDEAVQRPAPEDLKVDRRTAGRLRFARHDGSALSARVAQAKADGFDGMAAWSLAEVAPVNAAFAR